MTSTEFLERKGIDLMTMPGFKTPNVNGKQTFFFAMGIMEEFARIKCKEQRKICGGECLVGRTTQPIIMRNAPEPKF